MSGPHSSVGTQVPEVSSAPVSPRLDDEEDTLVTTIEFRAPLSGTVRFSTTIACGFLALWVAAVIFTSMRGAPLVIVLAGLPLLILGAAFAYRVRGYTLTEDAIIVRRGIGNTRLLLVGLRSVSGDVDAMRGSVRAFGNYGLFSITGYYWNRKLGWYRAFVTDPSRAVVLRYARRTIVISPHDPQHFIMRAGTLIKVAEFPK